MHTEENKLCPSSTCHEGATLLGVVQSNKKVTFLNLSMKVDANFVTTAKAVGSPEKRFRFADKCVKCGCKQWTGKRCGVMDKLSASNKDILVQVENLPSCSIREQCRWYAQEGGKACVICPFVITDNSI